jgi:hypothetical protein
VRVGPFRKKRTFKRRVPSDIRPSRASTELKPEVGHPVLGKAEDGATCADRPRAEAPLGTAAEDGHCYALEIGLAA